MTSIAYDQPSRAASGGGWMGLFNAILRDRGLFFLVIAVAMVPILFVPIQTGNNFLSDDMSMYWAAKSFGETGNLYIENDLTRNDAENLMHPRGFVTHEGRAVPYNFLGLPVLYGAAYAVVGDRAEYLGAALAGLSLLAIWGILGTLHGPRRAWAFPMIFLAFPLLYYFGRPYMNVVPTLSMFLVGLHFLLLHYQEPSMKKLLIASAFFALAIFCRYTYALFISPLVFIVLWQTYGSLVNRQLLRDAVIYTTVVAVLFGGPLLIFNQLTYGSPFTYGYGLFNDAYYPDRGGSDAAGLQGVVGTLSVWIMPGGFDLSMLAESTKKYFLFLAPGTVILAGIGYLFVWKHRPIPARYLLAYTLLILYIVAYNGSGAVWGTQFDEPTLGHTLVRYWLPAYLALALVASYTLLPFAESWQRMVLTLVVLGVGLVPLFEGKDSLPGVKLGISSGQEWVATRVLPYTEEDAVIYAGRRDKALLGSRQVAAWFNSAELSFFDPSQIASSMNRVRDQGRPVYIVREPDADFVALQAELEEYGLSLRGAGAGDLFAVIEVDMESQVTQP